MFQGVLNSINKGIKSIQTPNKYTIKGKEYTEVSLLGEGGFGYVYEVENALTGEKYALKRMSCSDKTVLENIKKEIEVWNKINNCPNIVKLIDYEFSNQFVSILMELCTEGNVFKMISNHLEKNTFFSEREALMIILDTAKGLAAMHAQMPPIAHRDIKIENILKMGNSFKLCDFGSSTTNTVDPKKDDKSFILDQFSSFDKFTTFMYRPPEMCDQYSKYFINEKVDVWMLGCVLYTVLFRKHPFQDAQKLAIINAHYYISEEDAQRYSEKLLDFMRLMLTPNPSNRPSINDVLNYMKNWKNITSIPLSEEVKEIKAKQLKNKKTTNSNNLNFLSAEDILRVQEQIKKDQMKKKRYVKSTYSDDDEEISAGVAEDIGENKYSNVHNTKGFSNNNNPNIYQQGFNFSGNNESSFNNIGNTFSNNNNINNTQQKQAKEASIWDFDFGANSNSSKVSQPEQAVKNNLDYSDFQFFDNNNKNINNNNISNNSNSNANKTSKTAFDDIFFNQNNNAGQSKGNNSATNNFTFDFNNLSISEKNKVKNNIADPNPTKNNFSASANTFDFGFGNVNNNNQKMNNVTNNLNKNAFNFDFIQQPSQPNPQNFNSKGDPQKNTLTQANNNKINNSSSQQQDIYEFFNKNIPNTSISDSDILFQ